jgi:FKBP-type peptidyl-prolyl cis-trans isomerase FklB
MKSQILAFIGVCLLACSTQAQPSQPGRPMPVMQPAPEPKTDFSKIFKNDSEKFGYAIGMSYGTGLKSKLKTSDFSVEMSELIKGFEDGIGTNAMLITEAQMREIFADLNKEMRARNEEKHKQQLEEARLKGEKNKTEGAAFLAKNKDMPGVVTLPSGLQYKVITNGTGPIPTANDEVTVNYKGTLMDGTEFDASAKRGRPFTTKVSGGVIKGWTEALQLMKTGSKWELYIPADLAYGTNAAGPLIAANSPLIFEIELLSTQPAPAPAAMAPRPASTPLTSDIIKVPSAEEIKKGAKIETIKAEDIDKAKANQ